MNWKGDLDETGMLMTDLMLVAWKSSTWGCVVSLSNSLQLVDLFDNSSSVESKFARICFAFGLFHWFFILFFALFALFALSSPSLISQPHPPLPLSSVYSPTYWPSMAALGVLKPKPTSLYHLLSLVCFLAAFEFWNKGCFWKALSVWTPSSTFDILCELGLNGFKFNQ